MGLYPGDPATVPATLKLWPPSTWKGASKSWLRRGNVVGDPGRAWESSKPNSFFEISRIEATMCEENSWRQTATTSPSIVLS